MYDVTFFLDDHPGGGEFILQLAGKDATLAMASDIHSHSEAAYSVLLAFQVGTVDDLDPQQDLQKTAFIDPHKPMIAQMLAGTFSKKDYLKHVHTAQHVPFSAPIFAHPALEVFTKTRTLALT